MATAGLWGGDWDRTDQDGHFAAGVELALRAHLAVTGWRWFSAF